MSERAWRVGVDVGGTFTDVVALDPDGHCVEFKVPSDPARPAAALLRALERVAEKASGETLKGLHVVHGTTVATNTLEERRGARTAFVTTRGFRDLLEIARQSRDEIYDVRRPARPPPFVSRELCFEITERLDVSGRVLTPLRMEEVPELTRQLKSAGVESVAVCLLHSYANPAHERRLGEALREAFRHVSLSCEVNAEFREYERALTTVLNAYLMPMASDFLSHLESDLAGRDAHLHLVQSNGGMMSASALRQRPLNLVMSGPAAGVSAGCSLTRDLGFKRALALDMGGTTTDVCLIEDGRAELMRQRTVGGQPIRLGSVAVESIGAGGGSLAWTDEVGALHVGPRSAGAEPGPACYGLGGKEPTLTDANLLLGYLNPDAVLGGRIRLRRDLAEEAVGNLARRLGVSPEETARGIAAIAEANVLGALRLVSVERGRDVRDGALVAYGGVGPLHAAALARALEVACVVVPARSSVFSALGCLTSDLRYEAVRTHHASLEDLSPQSLEAVWEDLLASTRDLLVDEGHAPGSVQVRTSLDLRYKRQNYEIEVPVGGMDGWTAAEVRAAFEREHLGLYRYVTDEPIECANVRVSAVVPRDVRLEEDWRPDGCAERELGCREVAFGGQRISTPVLNRAALRPEEKVEGPAVVEDEWSVTVLPPGRFLTVDGRGHLILRVKP
ncbi:MAG: hydantoinase/oxoprolinase family protein [Nitrospinota bacterium]